MFNFTIHIFRNSCQIFPGTLDGFHGRTETSLWTICLDNSNKKEQDRDPSSDPGGENMHVDPRALYTTPIYRVCSCVAQMDSK